MDKLDIKSIQENIISGEFLIKRKDRDESGKKRKFSGIWKTVFEIWKKDQNGEEIKVQELVCCSLCKHVMRYNTSNGTKTILNHIQKHEDKTCSVENSVRSISVVDKKKVLNASIKFVTKDLRPYTAVEGSGFLEFVETVWNLGANLGTVSREKLIEILPARQTVSSNIKMKADDVRNYLKVKLNAVFEEFKSIPMTTDIWTDNYKHISYVGLTAHFYDDDGNLCDRIIGMRALDSAVCKDNVYIRKIIEEMLDKYELKDKFEHLTFVTDRGGNVCVALNCATRLNCATHFNNNSVKAACDIDIVKDQIAECKSLVTYFKSTGLNNLLESSLKQALDIRFNSVCNMFDSILKNRSKIKEILEDRNEDHRLHNVRFNQVHAMFQFLDEYRHWSVMLSSSKSSSLYLVWIAIDKLLKHSTRSNSDSNMISLMKIKAYQYIEEKFVLHELHRVATILHPNFKSLKFATDELRKETVDNVRGLLNKFRSNASRTNERRNSSSSHSSVESCLSEYFDYEEEFDEVESYLSMKCVPEHNLNLIKWWFERRVTLPQLSQLALFVHSIPASSIPSERVFSTAGAILTEKRSNLTPDSIEDILLLHSQKQYSETEK